MLTPPEVLIAIHGIDPDRDGIPLKKAYLLPFFPSFPTALQGTPLTNVTGQVTDACNACFEQRQIFTQQVLAKVLNQLVCTTGNL